MAFINGSEIDNILDEIQENEVKEEKKHQLKWEEIRLQIRKKNMNYIKNLITSKEIEVNDQNPADGKTLLMYAVIIGDIDLVKAICNFGADVHIKDNDELDALDYAIKYGRYKITELVYYRQLSGSLGNDLKNISIQIHTKNQEAQYIYQYKKTKEITDMYPCAEYHQQLVDFVAQAIQERAPFNPDSLYYAWFIVSKKCEKEKTNPFEHKLWTIMMSVYEEIISNTSNNKGWKWLKERFINSLIWYLPHPQYNKINKDENESEEKEAEMENVLRSTLFYELLQRIRAESKKQSDLLLKEKVAKIKNEKADEWKQLISYNVNTKYSANARQDLSGCLKLRYTEKDLSEARYPPSTHFSAKKHYDTNIYLNELLFRANILDSLFQQQMKQITKQINQQTGDTVTYRAGPVKTLSRSQTKVENDYINEDYPTSAKILDINRCALQFESIQAMMKFIAIFTENVNNNTASAGCIKSILRCKNGWSVYNALYPQYSDIKLNVLVESQNEGSIIAEIQFLLHLMSSFKKKAHKLYSVERKFELVYNFKMLQDEMSTFKDVNDQKIIFKDLVLSDNIKFFKDLWENTPQTRHSFGETHAFAFILSSESGQIHNYLASKYKDLYCKSLLFHINTVAKSWNIFIYEAISMEQHEEKKEALKLRFVERLIHLFDDSHVMKVNAYADGMKILRSWNIIWDLLDHSLSCYIKDGMLSIPAAAAARCAINDDTEFKCVSDTFNGGTIYICGKTSDINALKPVQLNTNHHIYEFAACTNHTVAIDTNGGILAWGSNDSGQCGSDADAVPDILKPQLIASFTKYKAVRVAVGDKHSLVLTETGHLWSFGSNKKGQLGHQNINDTSKPVLIEALKHERIVQISCGLEYNGAISDKADLFCWGDNFYGQCAVNAKGSILTPTKIDINAALECMDETNPFVSLYVDCGAYHTLLLTTNGTVMAFGYGWHGQLGHGQKKTVRCPKIIEALSSKRVVDVAAGCQHSLCVTDDGECFSFGSAGWGQLGHATKEQLYVPQRIDFFVKENIQIVACDAACHCFHSGVITSDGECYMFGAGECGELGNGKQNEETYIPTKMKFTERVSCKRVALADYRTLVITENTKKDAGDKKEDEKNENIVYFKKKQQIKIKNGQSFDKIYMKSEEMFGVKNWMILADSEKNYMR